ncbi:glycosyltransferase [bacterium]|nr:glycosyltransferase [bacterium]NBX50057.1 glycosyltransferase [bacterium]
MGKTLIIHDRFQFRGGAERMILDLAKMLNADLVTEFWTDTTYPKSEVPQKLTVLDTGEPRMMVLRYFRAQWNFWWKTRHLLKEYDTIIFSGNNCLSAALRPLQGKKLVYYCHAPVRYVYDLLPVRRAQEPSLLKRIVYYDIGKWLIRGFYRLGLYRMQKVITNSQNVHDRLIKFCNTESDIIYPPIHTEKFSWQGQGDYYLSFARLDTLKRVGDIVRAFQHMPEKKLVIVSGGDDENNVAALAKGYENISLEGWVDDRRLKDLVGSCIATVYIPIDEDFGMTPVEGMSAGKPCIGVNEGGLKETIISGETGVLIPKEYRIEDLISAVQEMTPEKALEMRERCEQQARRFSRERFESEMQQVINKCHPEGAAKSTEGSTNLS